MYHQRFKTSEERLAEKYHVAASGCWIWNTGSADKYPFFWANGKHVRASHIMWEKHNGRALATGEQVLHECDTPACVNPSHLFVGDVRANMQDRKAKGRGNHPRGERNGRARITRHLANVIRTEYASGGSSQQLLADKYGMGQTTVSQIIRNTIWRD